MKAIRLLALFFSLIMVIAVGNRVSSQEGEGPGILTQKDLVIEIKPKPIKIEAVEIRKAKVRIESLVTDVDVRSLAHQYGLDDKHAHPQNPHLVFSDKQIKEWEGKPLDTVKREFAARMLILNAADKQLVAIRDQDMLSEAVRVLIPSLGGGIDTACLICGCPTGVTSQDLIKKAWDALDANKAAMDPKNPEKALACAKVTISRYGGKANDQQAKRQAHECPETPTKEQKDAYFTSYWALGDVAAAWFIRGQAFEQQKKCTEAKEAYQVIVSKYSCAYIWDPKGWFWNAAEGADQAIKDLEASRCTGKVQ